MPTIERKSRGKEADRWLITPGKTIFIDSNPRKITDLEGHLRTVRARYGIAQRTLAQKAEMTHNAYSQFELEKHTQHGREKSDKLLDGLAEIAHEDDPNAVAAVTILTATHMSDSERERISDLLEDTIFEGTVVFESAKERTRRSKYKKIISRTRTFGKALRQIRKAEGNLSIKNYAKKVGINHMAIGNAELGKSSPTMPTINMIVEYSPFHNMDPYAQIMRLTAHNLDVIQTREIPNLSFGEMIRYLRIAHGLTQPQLGDILNRPRNTIWRIEKNFPIPKNIGDDIKSWLENDPIMEVLQRMISNSPVPEVVARNVLYGNYIFAGNPVR